VRRLFRSIALACVIVLAIGVTALMPRGVEAVLRNADATTMRDVRIVVTGRSYALGDVPPGRVRSIRVRPAGESSLTIEYADATGTRSVRVDCYMEAGYSGSITVDVANGAVVRKVDRIGL
jgi:hypothetical protein